MWAFSNISSVLEGARCPKALCQAGFGYYFLSVAPKCSLAMATSSGRRSSSSRGTVLYGSSERKASSPMRPPTKMETPGTPFILPLLGSSFLAGAPISPMSATCTWPHELGQPVQWMRNGLGTSTSPSSFMAMRPAFSLVSIIARPQNCEPVQETVWPTMFPGSIRMRLWPFTAGSARRAGSAASSTLGSMAFCSTVSRISPAEYLSASSAICRASATESRPVGTCSPTRIRPSGCLCTPSNSRRVYGVVGAGCALSTLTPASAGSARSFWRKAAIPYFSITHISRAFCRSLRSP
mmetsp:Transcript_11929/g.24222  ORF Transcript_11929/g.24222 Transcript_11929/m.24222 type:complete len:295 (+) Transcript_11929:195-1079(+)